MKVTFSALIIMLIRKRKNISRVLSKRMRILENTVLHLNLLRNKLLNKVKIEYSLAEYGGNIITLKNWY